VFLSKRKTSTIVVGESVLQTVWLTNIPDVLRCD
jgi:hypothetical protein